MKKYSIFIFLFFLSACGYTGRIVFYEFNISKYEVESEIRNIIDSNRYFITPEKWKSHTEGDYFETMYVYFKNSPEELYQIGFQCDSATWKISKGSRLALIGIFQERTMFQFRKDLSRKEKDRIQERFESEFLSKLKYQYTKSDETGGCN